MEYIYGRGEPGYMITDYLEYLYDIYMTVKENLIKYRSRAMGMIS